MLPKPKTSFRTFKDKIMHNRRGYKLKDNSLGSILTQVLLQEEHKRVNPSYSLNSFSPEELIEAGQYIENRIEIDYQHTINLIDSILRDILPQNSTFNKQNPTFSPKDEFENLKFLAQRPQSGMHLDKLTKKRIEQVKSATSSSQIYGGMANSNINLDIFDETALYSNLSSKAKKSTPIKVVAYGTKSLESIIFKFLRKSADILEMGDETYFECIDKCSSKISKEELIDKILNYQTSLFSSGEGIYQFHYQNKHLKGQMKGPANELIERFFGVDYTRGRIVTTEHNMNYLQNIIRSNLENNLYFNILASRDEDFFNKKLKDNSFVLGIEGPKAGCMTELRIQTLQDFISGEFGKNSHAFDYKPFEIRKYKPIFKKSKKLNQIGRKLEIMFPDQKHYTQSLFK